MKGQCEAYVMPSHGGHRCQHAAKHTFETPGDAVRVCKQHYRVLHDRRRQGSDEEYVRRWRSQP